MAVGFFVVGLGGLLTYYLTNVISVGEEGDYTYRYSVTTGMPPALRLAATRAILMFH